MNPTTTKEEIGPTYVGSAFFSKVVYIQNFDQPEFVAEVGGTSLKMGRDWQVFRRTEEGHPHYAVSTDGQSYIFRKKRGYCLKYFGRLGDSNFDLRPQNELGRKDALYRQRNFEARFFGLRPDQSREELNGEFAAYQRDPLAYFRAYPVQ
ncbi:MAG: hypothetical protein AAFV95_17095 [Bacteroidota bacterium]